MLIQWLTFAVLPLTEACGVAVHSYLVERILPQLPAHVLEKKAFIRAGAFYPDAFYNCMGQYDVAEEAHWPPFLAAGISIIKRRHAVGDYDTASLEAFLVGILTHQIADISWHSLGIYQGLLRAMSDSEFDGDYDDAHTVLDVGGDMIQLHRLTAEPRQNNWLNSEWEYNAADIQEIQRAVGYADVSQSAIKYCMTRGKAALNAEMNVASVGYKRFARRSPLLFDQLESYFVGGLTDMQQQIEECMPTFLDWLNGAPFEDPWLLCQVFEGKRPTDEGNSHELRRRKGDPLMSVNGILEIFRDAKSSAKKSMQHKLVTSLECEVVPVPEPGRDAVLGSGVLRPGFGKYVITWKTNWAVASPDEGKVYVYDAKFNLNTTIVSNNPVKAQGKFAAQFGTSLAVWEDYLVVASPGLSTLDVFNMTGNWLGAITWPNATTQYGQRGVKMVGLSLAVDEDLGTLYVGAPFCDNLELDEPDQVGAVYTIPRSIMLQSVTGSTVELGNDENLLARGEVAYQRLGAQLSLTNRFVLVGSPGTELVYGFDFATHKKILTIENPSGMDPNSEGFGGYLLSGDRDYVVIGAPASNGAVGTQNGKVTIYKNTQMQSVEGSAEFEWFGMSGIVTTLDKQRELLIASSHAADERGLLWTLNLHTQELAVLGSPPVPAGSGFGQFLACNGTVAVMGMPSHKNMGSDRLGAIAVVQL